MSSYPKSIIHMEGKILDYLGKISYGIYMFHMIVIYALTFLCSKYLAPEGYNIVFLLCYLITVFGCTIGLSALSYTLFEKRLIIKGSLTSKRVTEAQLERKSIK